MLTASVSKDFHPAFAARLSLGTGSLQWGGKPREYPGEEAFFLDATGQTGATGGSNLFLMSDPTDNASFGIAETFAEAALKAPAAELDTAVWGKAYFPTQSGTFTWDLVVRRTTTITAASAFLAGPYEIAAMSLGNDLVAGIATRPSDKAVSIFWAPRDALEKGTAVTVIEPPELKETTPLAIRTWGGWLALQYRTAGTGVPRERVAILDATSKEWRTLNVPSGWTTVRYGVSVDDSAIVLGLLSIKAPALDTDGTIRRIMRIDRSALTQASMAGFVP